MTESDTIRQLRYDLQRSEKEDFAKQKVINELREVIRLIVYEIMDRD